jgi:toxin ParE1/3/4
VKYNLFFSAAAEDDLFEIYKYVFEHDCEANADRLIAKLRAQCKKLQTTPARGHTPPELREIGVMEFLEISIKPFRIIYQILGSDVFVHCVLDGRRDMQALLRERMFR